MEKPPVQTRVIPESALLHFAFTQAQYLAVYAATDFFARKLQDPAKREQALSALGVLKTPVGFSLASETTADEAAPVEEHGATSRAQRTGLGGLRK